MRYFVCTLILLFITSFGLSQSDIEKVKETVTKDEIKEQIYYLASDELRGRDTGTPEIDTAATYLAAQFKKYGVQPMGDNGTYFQKVLMEKTGGNATVSLKLGNLEVDNILPVQINNTIIKARVVHLGYGLAEDYSNSEVKGKIVMVKSGSPEHQDVRSAFGLLGDKRALAMQHGAAALIEVSDANNALWNRLKGFFGREKLSLKKENGSKLVHLWIQDGGLDPGNLSDNAELAVYGMTKKEIIGKNVVGYLPGKNSKLKEEYLIYSAHYDHVGVGEPNAENDSIFNGARDNAVGTVTVLSAAKNIAKFPTERSALFILFTAEEKGLLGSKWYVEHPVLPLDKAVFCFNSDNGGYNDTSLITVPGLYRTTAGDHIVTAAEKFGLKAIKDPTGGLFDRSDNVNFAQKGIPSPTFSMGFDAFDEEINKYYHQAADNPDTLDYNYLERFFKAYVLSCRLIANDPETPHWAPGDKYFRAGEGLYGEE